MLGAGAVAAMLAVTSSLTSLDVSECRLAVTDAVLEAIGAHCAGSMQARARPTGSRPRRE